VGYQHSCVNGLSLIALPGFGWVGQSVEHVRATRMTYGEGGTGRRGEKEEVLGGD
jgi:hypothetical protein